MPDWSIIPGLQPDVARAALLNSWRTQRNLSMAKDQYRDSWFQQLVPVRTVCLRCGTDSPIVFLPMGELRFGAKGIGPPTGPDITEAAIKAFNEIHWHFAYEKAYCPTCKGFGT